MVLNNKGLLFRHATWKHLFIQNACYLHKKQVESHVWRTDRLTMWRNMKEMKEGKRRLMNSLNNLYLLQLPSRVSSDDFHMDCAAACCSQGQFAHGKALVEECCGSSRPANIPPRHSFLHCPVAVGLAASPWLTGGGRWWIRGRTKISPALTSLWVAGCCQAVRAHRQVVFHKADAHYWFPGPRFISAEFSGNDEAFFSQSLNYS